MRRTSKYFTGFLGCVHLIAFDLTIAKEAFYFPPVSGEWETMDSDSSGWDTEKLNALITFAGRQKSSGLLITQNGKILLEHYWPKDSYDSDNGLFSRRLHGADAYGGTIEDVASVQKSIAALIVGIAQEKGFLSIDDPVHKHLGVGWSRATKKQEETITIRHLISMTSGLKKRPYL